MPQAEKAALADYLIDNSGFSKGLSSWATGPAVGVANGTDALALALRAYGVGPGDEVILPSFTFVSTANAFVLRGARPVFCDVRPDTLNLDEQFVERLITARTRAIVAVPTRA